MLNSFSFRISLSDIVMIIVDKLYARVRHGLRVSCGFVVGQQKITSVHTQKITHLTSPSDTESANGGTFTISCKCGVVWKERFHDWNALKEVIIFSINKCDKDYSLLCKWFMIHYKKMTKFLLPIINRVVVLFWWWHKSWNIFVAIA